MVEWTYVPAGAVGVDTIGHLMLATSPAQVARTSERLISHESGHAHANVADAKYAPYGGVMQHVSRSALAYQVGGAFYR